MDKNQNCKENKQQSSKGTDKKMGDQNTNQK